ncbi:MAG: hypothetical protein LBQ88_23415, partial [Treponema sp.]|nr:hypothetical protein [Treponema sp.]
KPQLLLGLTLCCLNWKDVLLHALLSILCAIGGCFLFVHFVLFVAKSKTAAFAHGLFLQNTL